MKLILLLIVISIFAHGTEQNKDSLKDQSVELGKELKREAKEISKKINREIEDKSEGLKGNFNEMCKKSYKKAFEDLYEAMEDYNSDTLVGREFIATVAGIDVFLMSKRTACHLFEDEKNESCVNLYYKQYKKLLSQVSYRRVWFQTQKGFDLNLEEVVRKWMSKAKFKIICE